MLATWAIAIRILPGTAASIWGMWVVAMAVGFGLSFWRGRQERGAPVSHPVNRQIGIVWFAIGMPMLLLFFVGQQYDVLRPTAIPTTAAALLGSGIYITGSLAKINWLRNLAVVWWLASIALMLVRGASVFLIYGLLLIALYVLPGLRLNRMVREARAA